MNSAPISGCCFDDELLPIPIRTSHIASTPQTLLSGTSGECYSEIEKAGAIPKVRCTSALQTGSQPVLTESSNLPHHSNSRRITQIIPHHPDHPPHTIALEPHLCCPPHFLRSSIWYPPAPQSPCYSRCCSSATSVAGHPRRQSRPSR